ncbi:MAG: citrate transporter [Butyrivibrio sp.]|nr:citrate transporter [Butyrivibrio sp.]
MKRIKYALHKMITDPVLCIAWILAIISALIVRPDSEYLSYIDFRSLGILWGLMVVIQGYRENSVFEKIGEILLKKVKTGWQLSLALVFVCFLGSMFITNDVALITFVPFAIMTLSRCNREDLMIPIVVLQTVAANLGSMLTPVGNPQNLYLYSLTGMSLFDFIKIMLPYSLATLIFLLVAILFLPKKKEVLCITSENYNVVKSFGSLAHIIIYSALFIVSVLTVIRVVPINIMVVLILLTVSFIDSKIIFRADYILLLTFVGFFIFTGNIERIPGIKAFLSEIITGRKFIVSLITSQFISNVPATLLLSDFTTDYKELLLGVNIGGLGTLIASMTSLISFKLYTNDYKEKRFKYIIIFTGINLVFLILLTALKLFLN